MGNNKGWIAILLILLIPGGLILQSFGVFSVTGSERIARSYSSTVDPGATVPVTYTVSGGSGQWGATVVDTMTCPGVSNQEKKFVIISDEGTTKTIQYTMPNAEGVQCTLSGNYQFGNKSLISFTTQTISTRVTTVSHSYKSCIGNDVYWYNSKNVVEDLYQSCGSAGCLNGACRVCKISIDFDFDCNNQISRDELGTSITKWINNQINRDQLGAVISAWAVA